jgi:Xaa-Pro aminopeptidase
MMVRMKTVKMGGQYVERRQRAVAAALKKGRVRALLVSQPDDVSYLTGFSGEDSFLLLVGDDACLLTDGRFDEQAHRECGQIDIHIRTGPMSKALLAVLKARRFRGTVGVQSEHFTLGQFESFEKNVGKGRFKPLAGLVGPLREIKDAGEIVSIGKAVKAAQAAFMALLRMGKEFWLGKTERQLAAELDYRMRLAGSSKPSFETIVAAGPNGALPHYRPGAVKVREGTAVLIDWGATVDGYVSDLTRVVFVGRIPPQMGTVYDVVRRAQLQAIAAVSAGVPAKDVDAAARGLIERDGFGDRFVHGLGHGIGRAVHEGPGVARSMDAPLRAGMVITIEPGIYIPGVGGVRIEDDVEVTASGRRKLSTLATDVEEMTLQ